MHKVIILYVCLVVPIIGQQKTWVLARVNVKVTLAIRIKSHIATMDVGSEISSFKQQIDRKGNMEK